MKKITCLLTWLFFSGFAWSQNISPNVKIKRGDEFYNLRAESFLNEKKLTPINITAAIAAYREALLENPKNISIHLKLIEALYFLGYHATSNQEVKEHAFSECVELGNKAFKLLEEETNTSDLQKLSAKDQASVLSENRDAAGVYFWSAISIGLWGMTYGNFASARQDVAGKIRDLSSVLIILEPEYRDGAGYRLLGRLYTVAPKIPLFTMWIDREEGITLLEKAYSISNKDLRNGLFLAEALLKYRDSEHARACKILEGISQQRPKMEYYMEELETVNLAKSDLESCISNQ